jgi:D-alanyl-D-alanine carboxypeptidase
MSELVRTASAEAAVRRFQRVLDDFVDILGNLGALAAIDVQGAGRLYLASGHADIGRTERANREHLFQMGSQSKTFVTVTLLLMARAGHLSLEDPVVGHLDVPIDPRITVRHLLMNSSGLGEYTRTFLADRYDPRVPMTPRDLISLAMPQGQLFEPGAHFDYCNTGWVIAAQVIEKLAGRPYQDVVRDLVLAPLGMNDTSFGGHPPKARMLRGYIRSGALTEPLDASDALGWAYGAGDGVSGLDDMLDFYGGLIRADSPIALSLADLNHRTAVTSADPHFALSIGAEYGLGIERRAWAGREVWGHPGSTMSYMTSTWVDAPLGLTVTTCVTRVATVGAADTDLRYPRAQLFAMALNTGYALAGDDICR